MNKDKIIVSSSDSKYYQLVKELFLSLRTQNLLDEYGKPNSSTLKQKIDNDTIFRLLSPLLYIFFGLPNNKNFKAEINKIMKNHEIDKLESLFLEFIR